MFQLPELPYTYGSLEPYISARTLHCHYDDHHRGYLDKLNGFLDEIDFEYYSVDDIVMKSAGRDDLIHIYTNAAQVSNHTFFWNCMRPVSGGEPTGNLKRAIEESFGSVPAFRKAFVEAATGRFGSGYVWLVRNESGLSVRDTANADPAYLNGDDSLLCCDVWEHAYYLDYQSGRADFVKNFLEHLVDWEAVAARLAGDTPRIVRAD